MSEITVRVVQSDSVLGDVARNTGRARDEIERTRADRVDLLVFPELFLSGYRIDRTASTNSAVARTARDALDRLALETSGLAVVVGAPLPAEGNICQCMYESLEDVDG
ncbi:MULTISPECIES: nitrilase-related carbon-nitrogen hydrolase [Natrialbaceae]|uniref:nitrilase-related carbon-nitrogen hydrolase n=1 Tax=Natrialbaceae TaxID=1644061 RepID=UPI00207C84BB|nr:nitrilase-related carbon-nitrogen hydrolase [Natronococcus sp. CG52]